ncbi:hypothetical protein OS965_26035 [Streptomyces sp. H27-G5]|uniref:hypothetical protein n=1 Tax=Streptomyces sp. H27-G5 TaxID=2996698 RepID=UPI00226FCC11|nr:hypothetical protein [Streptomyces sp. H27-G5]MCY0921591.1 hypothetical protein [Streptomyces sp. H27-G5]
MRSPRPTSRRTAFRTAAVLAGATAVLALPVGAAFADSPAAPDPQVLPGVEQPAVDPTFPQTVPSTVPAGASPTKPARGYVTTARLADGSVAKIYDVGVDHVEADVFAGSTKLGTLVSRDGRPAYGQNNGLHITLYPNGTVSSWVEAAPKPKPKPQSKPKPVVEQESAARIVMPDGNVAEAVYGVHGKRVDLSTANGHRLGTIDLKDPNALNDGWMYKLVRDGRHVKFVVIDGKSGGNSWVYDFDSGKLIERYTVASGK